MTLDEMLKKAEEVLGEHDALTKKLEGAEGDDAKALQEALEGKQAEFDGLQKKIEQAQAQAKRKKLVADAKAELKVEPAGNLAEQEPKPEKQPAKAKDAAKEEREYSEQFLGYCQGKQLEGVARKALAPKSEHFIGGSNGVVVPRQLASKIMGRPFAKAFGMKDNTVGTLPMDSGNEGSNLVPEEYRAELLRMRAEPPHVLDYARVVPCSTGTITWPKLTQSDSDEYGSVAGAWTTEGASKEATDAVFEQKQVSTFEYSAYTEISHTLLNRSAIQLESLLSELFKAKVQDALDDAFLTGSGSGSNQPLGITNTSGINSVVRDTADTVSWLDLVDLEFELQAYHRAGCIFLLADGVTKVLKKSTDGDNRPLFQSGIAAGVPETLAGYPYLSTHRLPSIGTEGDVVFADLREYVVPMEQEVVIKSSDDYKFRNNVRAFTVFVIVGGELVQPRAGAILEAGTS